MKHKKPYSTYTRIDQKRILKIIPLSLFISRFPEFDITLPLLNQSIHTIASTRNRDLQKTTNIYFLIPQQRETPKESKINRKKRKKKKVSDNIKNLQDHSQRDQARPETQT